MFETQGGSTECEGRNDGEEFVEIRSAMKVMEMTDQEIWDVLKILAALLHLGKLLAESVDSPDSPSCESREYVPSARKKYRMEVVHVLTCGKGFCRVIPAMTFYQMVKKGFFG